MRIDSSRSVRIVVPFARYLALTVVLAVVLAACGSRTPLDLEGELGETGGTSGASGDGSTGGAGAQGARGGADGRGGTSGRGGNSGSSRDGSIGDVGGSKAPDGCPRVPCVYPQGRYCGIVGDGCGGIQDCGECPAPQQCGLAMQSVCGTPCPLCADVPQCDGAKTTLSGVAVTGARQNPDPLYRAVVYIPNIARGTKLPPITNDGPICNTCQPITPDNAVVSAVTGPDGKFTLENVPAGKDVPIVVQLDRWRYQTTIDVLPCASNAVPADTLHLPRNRTEGDIPLTAISTGNVDALECVLRKMGIDDSEFTNPDGTGRIHVYRNNGARLDAATPLESELTGESSQGAGAWDRYDQVVLACEGMQQNHSALALTNFSNYVNRGGRVFATHFRYTWLTTNGPFANIANWQLNGTSTTTLLTGRIDTTTPRGSAFAIWLQIVGALSQVSPPEIQISDPRYDVASLRGGQGAQLWIDSTAPMNVQHFTVDTPVLAAPEKICGRVIFSDFHVTTASGTQGIAFPTECDTRPLTPQEKVLEYMLLDLASCTGSTTPPTMPPPPI